MAEHPHAAQLAALHAAVAARPPAAPERRKSDEEILAEDLAEHRAEETKRDRQTTSDWTARRLA